MLKPRFVCGAYDVSPEHPSDWEIENLVEKDEQTTLGGELTIDVVHRKYIYTLSWEAMSVGDFDDMEELINYSLDNDLDITFTYPKWPQVVSGATVRIDMPRRVRRGGSGSTAYYSTVILNLKEVSKRA